MPLLRVSTSAAKRFALCIARPSSSLLCSRRSCNFLTSIPYTSKHPQTTSPPNRTHTLFARYSSSNSAISDPSRPDLFYHVVSLPMSPSVYALSFLTQPPPTPDSCSVIGWLPAETTSEGGAEAGLNDFVENPKFRAIMHEAIQTALREQEDAIWINGALQLQQGWMHIHDSRNIPALGRIGDPDDIIASVLVQDSKILSETYQPMPSYRVCTSDGPTLLTDGLAAKLKSVLGDAIAREAAQ
ncbi:uncharacterized protein EDB91DRAFT_1140164 [Suillus paluster]|uniref:uncharacterized protein n=1 Tax=Suillus paluster TaxID=48578 RepID=UPI001B868A5C|nr:uncharacterized protein EDB91DRAFT_1140164 [Suillus paluster]KAG1737494.1 hypothetical protein EDB91DRAFT_1140164 [Suillus paluster]